MILSGTCTDEEQEAKELHDSLRQDETHARLYQYMMMEEGKGRERKKKGGGEPIDKNNRGAHSPIMTKFPHSSTAAGKSPTSLDSFNVAVLTGSTYLKELPHPALLSLLPCQIVQHLSP